MKTCTCAITKVSLKLGLVWKIIFDFITPKDSINRCNTELPMRFIMPQGNSDVGKGSRAYMRGRARARGSPVLLSACGCGSMFGSGQKAGSM